MTDLEKFFWQQIDQMDTMLEYSYKIFQTNQ